jgi:hypothetical protein
MHMLFILSYHVRLDNLKARGANFPYSHPSIHYLNPNKKKQASRIG